MHKHQEISEEKVFGGVNKRYSITIYTYAKLPVKLERKAYFSLWFEIKGHNGVERKTISTLL